MAGWFPRRWLQRLVALVRRWGRHRPSRHALPPPGVPQAGRQDFLADVLLEGAVTDPGTDPWLRQLRTDLPFPQPRYGTWTAPATARDVVDLLATLDAEVRTAMAAAEPRGGMGEDPDWFVLLADKLLPVAAWFAGVGLTEGAAPPDWLRDLAQKVRRVPGAGRTLDWLDERIARLSEHNAGTLAAYFALLKVHVEAALATPGVELTFDFPAPGARVAALDPPPAHGSPTSGTVGRVLCPAVTIRFPATDAHPPRVLSRGAHIRA